MRIRHKKKTESDNITPQMLALDLRVVCTEIKWKHQIVNKTVICLIAWPLRLTKMFSSHS